MDDLARRYELFGQVEAIGYRPLTEGITRDTTMLGRIAALPEAKQQPNLLFAAVRYLGGPTASYPAFAAFVAGRWPEVRATMLARSTQTNEAARCAVLLPALGLLDGPLALVEVGASAGLCLYPDRYGYRYTLPGGREHLVGPPEGAFTCAVDGPAPLPGRTPEVVWRAGVDLNPLDVRDPDTVAWLRALIWPWQPERLAHLERAIAVAEREPPPLVRGDLNDTVEELVAAAPQGATVVVYHTAVMPYLSQAERERFATTVRGLPCHWLANEGPARMPWARMPQPPPSGRAVMVLVLDGRPLAYAGPHGQSLSWFA
ncbi:DUF2332 domain-containing protein [Nonomuraea sp. NPDC059194]|uniref:DUF2332 domain-containing protein n=1 Tax=Nonomuraea sp. NPDC059194 TaxID=3346764 RepID=UPI0036995018